jgi:hypothetical protein
MTTALGVAAFGLLFFLIGIAVIVYEVNRVSGLSGKTTGVIVGYGIQEDDDAYWMQVKYRYKVNEEVLEHAQTLNGSSSGNREKYERLLKKEELARPIKSKIQVHYSPHHPQKSLPDYLHKINSGLITVGVIFGGAGVATVIGAVFVAGGNGI